MNKETVQTEKEIIDDQKCLVNWNTDKGEPFTYGCLNNIDSQTEPTHLVVLQEKMELDEGDAIKRIKFNLHLKELAELDLKYSSLINGEYEGKLVSWIDLLKPKGGEPIYDKEKPIKVFIDYPFDKGVEATIFPLIREFKDKEGKAEGTSYLDLIGYYAIQIAKAYAEIYKNRWKDVGVWGHGFSDLYLEEILIHPNNRFDLFIGS